ncbi:DUF6230 family protein [Streptomyces sp. NPDC001415]
MTNNIECLTGRAGRTSKLRFALALAPLSIGATTLLAGSAAGAVSVAFAGQVPVTVHAERVSGSGLTASPAASGRSGLLPALATQMEHASVENVCVTSTAQLPVIGSLTAVVRVKQASATGLTVQAGTASARSVSVSGARLTTPQLSPTGPTGLFSIGADKVTGEEVRTEPRAFTAGTITASGVSVDLQRGTGGCEREGRR